MNVRTIWVTPEAEKQLLYIARVSNPAKQDSGDARLIKYLLDHKHVSPFEMISWCVEINTSRAISAQILRHRSFKFQEFSQRYAKALGNVFYSARRQDTKNRQNSIDDLSEETLAEWDRKQTKHWYDAEQIYKWALDQGIAKESARMILPMSTATRLYMHGTVRDWIFYILLRTDPTVQKEHRDIANEIKELFIYHFPVISEALDWQV